MGCVASAALSVQHWVSNTGYLITCVFPSPGRHISFIISRFATVCGIGKSQKIQKEYNLVVFGTSLEITKKIQNNYKKTYSPDAPGRPPAIQNYKTITKKLLPGYFFCSFFL